MRKCQIDIKGTSILSQQKTQSKNQTQSFFSITIPDQYKKTGILVKTLQIKLSARVMLTNNIDVIDGLRNGAMGTITHLVSHDRSTVFLVKFDNACVGQAAKGNSKYKHITKSTIPIKHYQASFQIHGK